MLLCRRFHGVHSDTRFDGLALAERYRILSWHVVCEPCLSEFGGISRRSH